MKSELVETEFDHYAENYDAALNQGIAVSGENAEFFAKRRIEWTRSQFAEPVSKLLDFGCGVGIATQLMHDSFEAICTVGFDPSVQAIEVARGNHTGNTIKFTSQSGKLESNSFDLVYCNGVFHHIEPKFRKEALAEILRVLKPNGRFAFWENNPWNPGTRYIMSRIPFDRDAVTISPTEAKRLLTNSGFDVTCQHSLFWFPKMLSWLRPLEKYLCQIPLGAQYLVLCCKTV